MISVKIRGLLFFPSDNGFEAPRCARKEPVSPARRYTTRKWDTG